LEPADATSEGSVRNRLAVTVTSVTEIGNRTRVGLAAPQPLTAEITGQSSGLLGLAPGVALTASFKATATRLIQR
jgi:molybdopterin-binding protein